MAGKLKLKDKIKQGAEFILRLLLLGVQVTLFFIVLYRILPVPITPLVVMRGFPMERDWVSFDRISPKMVKAAITAEDPKFVDHYGFDLEAIQESIKKSMDKGKKPKGRSTISQQTAKNLFFGPARNWVRKGLEVPITMTLEVLWTKKRIIEVYLNIIEMGDRIYGIEAAAQHYYKKPAAKLTATEAAQIVVCLPNPRVRNPRKLNGRLQRKQQTILRWMNGFEPAPEWWWKQD